MANSPQSRKRARQADTRRKHNGSLRAMMRTQLKKMRALLSNKNAEAAQHYVTVCSVLDKMASKGLIHKNKSARHKKRFNAQLKVLSSHE